MAEGARCRQVEVVLDEIAAGRHAMGRANPGDLVVLCVDKHPAVMVEPKTYSHRAGRRRHRRHGVLTRRRPGRHAHRR